MSTCFIFFQNFNDTTFKSILLDKNGNEILPFADRSIDELIKESNDIVIVLDAKLCSFFEVELPLINEKKVRNALPYALEEDVVQNVDALHFAFSRDFYANNRYLVTVIDKKLLTEIINFFAQHKINFDAITLDWFGLPNDTVYPSNDGYLIRKDVFKGWLSKDLCNLYLENQHNALHEADINKDDAILENHLQELIAKGLVKNGYINLCQGTLLRQNQKRTAKTWYKIAATFAGILLLTILSLDLLRINLLNKEINQVDEDIALVYKKFFPDAKHVISPRFRIEQLLKKHQVNDQKIWLILNELGINIDKNDVKIEKITLQNQTLLVTLIIDDFVALEKFENQLGSGQINVKQKQAQSHENKVQAILELTA